MSFLTDFSTWKDRLRNVTWYSTEGSNKILGNRVGHAVELSYSTKLMGDEDMPIQIVLRLTINGKKVAHWGSIGLKNTSEVVEFFTNIYNQANGIKFDDERRAEDEALKVFNDLF